MKKLSWGPIAAVAVIVLAAVAAPVLGLENPIKMDVAGRLLGPGGRHWLGQDEYGRDVLSRLIWGARTSLFVAGTSTAIACLIGTALGVLGGYVRGIVELMTLRAMDVILCFPPLLLALLVVTLTGPGAGTLILVLSVLYVPGFARVAYAGVLAARNMEYVEAQRALGAGAARIMLRTIVPNIAGPLLVQGSLAAASAVVLESGLSFLGLGVVPPAPSWGLMIGAARATMNQAPLLLLWPCLALTATILAMNALCDTMRDAVDPHRPPPVGARRVLGAILPGMLPEAVSPILRIRNLTIAIDTPGGVIRPVRDLSLHIGPGETLAIVGESGSGKSLTGLAVMGLLPQAARVEAGEIWLQSQELLRLDESLLRRLRGERFSMIFQDPMSSLNPVHRIGAQIGEGISAHRRLSGADIRRRVLALLRRVSIPDPERRVRAYPHELSGGMRQRVMIAMAVANGPRLLIADEPTTALDVTIQAQVLELLADLKRESGLALIFITHSLPVVAEIADRVAVMYAGEIVEEGCVEAVFDRPLHPYTAALLASAPREAGGENAPAPQGIRGSVPLPYDLPPGCRFAPRCDHRLAACETAPPPLREVATGRRSRCIRWAET